MPFLVCKDEKTTPLSMHHNPLACLYAVHNVDRLCVHVHNILNLDWVDYKTSLQGKSQHIFIILIYHQWIVV